MHIIMKFFLINRVRVREKNQFFRKSEATSNRTASSVEECSDTPDVHFVNNYEYPVLSSG